MKIYLPERVKKKSSISAITVDGNTITHLTEMAKSFNIFCTSTGQILQKNPLLLRKL